MNTSINLQGKTENELQGLKTQIAYDYFAPETSDEQRDELTVVYKAVSTCLPYSFVLASLFDVESLTLDVPDFAYELDPCIGFTECPDCEGQGWVEVEGSAWYNPSWPFHTFSSMKRCEHCHSLGEVLGLQTLETLELAMTTVSTAPNTWLMAA
jgi:hypothetical protein